MSTISIVNFSGRLFDRPVKPKEDGLVTGINYGNPSKDSLKTIRALGVVFNDIGDQFAISDSRGCVTVYYISQNRYMAVAKNTKANDWIGFISCLKAEQIIVSNSDFSASIYGMKGKLISTLRGHRSAIQKFCFNIKHWLILSQSKDVINLWDRDKHTKIRSIFAQNSSFKDCKFTQDGSKVCTLFKDSTIYFWNISNFDSDFKITGLPKELQLEAIDCSTKYLAWGGKTPYLVIFNIEFYFTDKDISKRIYKLPEGFEKGISKIQFLRGNLIFSHLYSIS